MRATVTLFALLLACGCSSSAAPATSAGDETSASAETTTSVARGDLSEAELADLRAVVATLTPGMSHDDVMAALGARLDGLGAMGTGPTSGWTEIRVLGGRNVLWLTWNSTVESDTWLIRAVMWNEATDPMPPDLPYPPDPRPTR